MSAPSRLLSQSEEIPDFFEVATEALAVVYELNPLVVHSDVLLPFLDRRAPPHATLLALNTCSRLLRDEQALLRLPSSLDFGLNLVIPLRALLHQAVTSTFGTDEYGQPSLKPDQYARVIMNNEFSERNNLLAALVHIWHLQPRLFFLYGRGSAASPVQRVFPLIISASSLLFFEPYSPSQTIELLCCLFDENNCLPIQRLAQKALLEFQRSAVQVKWDPDPLYYTSATSLYRQTASTVGLAIAHHCLQPYPEKPMNLASLVMFSDWLGLASNVTYGAQDRPDVRSTLELCESAGILSLCSSGEEDRASISRFFQNAACHAQFHEVLFPNLKGLAEIMRQESTPVVGGRIAQMKRLTKILTGITVATSGLVTAWDLAWQRWQILARRFQVGRRQLPTESIEDTEVYAGKIRTPAEHELVEWSHISGFLTSSLDIIALIHSKVKFSAVKRPETSLQHTHLVGDGQQFLSEMTDLLTSEHSRMRDVARELLSHDLKPTMLLHFLRGLTLAASFLTDHSMLAIASERVTLLFEQILAILTSLLGRSGSMDSIVPSEELSILLQDTLSSAAYYSRSIDHGTVGPRLTIKFCRAIDLVLENNVAHMTDTFRMTLSDFLIAFLSDTALVSHSCLGPAFTHTTIDRISKGPGRMSAARCSSSGAVFGGAGSEPSATRE